MEKKFIYKYQTLNMIQHTQILPVGHTLITLTESVKLFPTTKIVMVLGKNPKLSGEAKVKETANALEKQLQPLYRISRLYVDKEDFYGSIIDIIQLIKKEREKGAKILINISGSLRQLGIACYIAAVMTQTDVFSTLPLYIKGELSGIKNVYKLPFFPVKELSPEALEILTTISKNEPLNSIDQLVSLLNPSLEKNSTAYLKERSRISYHLKKLKDEDFIHIQPQGKTRLLQVSQLGMIYLLSRT